MGGSLIVSSQWRTLRKIMNSHIFSVHNLDVSKHLRCEKDQELIDYCRKRGQNCEAVDIGRATFRTSLNLLSNTVFSKDLTDPFSDTAKEFKELVNYFPFLQRIDPQGIRRRRKNHFTMVLQLMSGLIDERLKERTDTTSNTLEWAMAELLKNPHTLEKAQEELEQVIDRGKLIDEADVANYLYFRCIVKETFRIRPQAPFLVRHKAVEDVEFCGYIIPKDSLVLVNVWAIGRDSSLWEDPLDFKSERFGDSEISVRGQDFELIPFDAGRRICPELPLAIRMIPVALGSLLNTFNWKLPSGIAPKDLDMEENFGITLAKAQPLLVVPICCNKLEILG
ncbi:Geraniol 8-hydroxylase [Capsicum chinense]|nr:Geraniol 8-hydroxylase [Capsicum chinense]